MGSDIFYPWFYPVVKLTTEDCPSGGAIYIYLADDDGVGEIMLSVDPNFSTDSYRCIHIICVLFYFFSTMILDWLC